MKTATLLTLVWLVITLVMGNLYVAQIVALVVEINYPGWGSVGQACGLVPLATIVIGWAVYGWRWIIRTANDLWPNQ